MQARLAQCLVTLIEDLLFASWSLGSADEDVWRGLAERRASVYEAQAQGKPVSTPAQGSEWVLPLVKALTPIAPPLWVPMRELLAKGLTLEGGARGARSLFTAKPSDKEVQRVRRLGTLAVRVTGAVMGADGPLSVEETRLRSALITSLGLPDEYAKPLLTEPVISPATLDIYGELDSKTAESLVQGAWLVAAQDGLDNSEEAAIALLANRLSVPMQDAANYRAEARVEIESRHAFGRTLIDALRYVLQDEPEAMHTLSSLAADLAIPIAYRADVLNELCASQRADADSQVRSRPATSRDGVAGHRERLAVQEASETYKRTSQRANADSQVRSRPATPSLSRTQRFGVLASAWASALFMDPSISRRAELAARHEAVATQLGAMMGDGARSRSQVEAFLEAQLAVLVRMLGASA